MFITAIFCLIAALMLGAPLWAFIVGFLCFVGGPLVLFFGFFLCVAMDAHIGYWIIGLICVLLDM